MRPLFLTFVVMVGLLGCGGSSSSHDLGPADQAVAGSSPDQGPHTGADLAGVDLASMTSCDPSGSCTDGPACGSSCCGAGEWCDGTTCHCGIGDACTTKGDTCHPMIGSDNASCGSSCCGGSTHPCLN